MKVETIHPRTGKRRVVEMTVPEYNAMKKLSPIDTRIVDVEMIKSSIKVNEETFKQASATLQEILDEAEPRRPYYLERLTASLNLCSDICRNRARLESELIYAERIQ